MRAAIASRASCGTATAASRGNRTGCRPRSPCGRATRPGSRASRLRGQHYRLNRLDGFDNFRGLWPRRQLRHNPRMKRPPIIAMALLLLATAALAAPAPAAADQRDRLEEHTPELTPLMRIPYPFFC